MRIQALYLRFRHKNVNNSNYEKPSSSLISTFHKRQKSVDHLRIQTSYLLFRLNNKNIMQIIKKSIFSLISTFKRRQKSVDHLRIQTLYLPFRHNNKNVIQITKKQSISFYSRWELLFA